MSLLRAVGVPRPAPLWLGLAALALALRVSNAFTYPIGMGFDAIPNWEYIEGLAHSWRLPHPEDGFTTAHPPLFYYAAAVLREMLGIPGERASIVAVRGASSVAGLLAIAFAMRWLLRREAEHPERAWLAAGLIAFLPAHIYASAMLNEEIVAASLTTLALVALCTQLEADESARDSLLRAACVGALGGLAWLTKLSGVLVVCVSVAAYSLAGWQRGRLRRGLALALTCGAVAAVVGGWFYVRNWVSYGYLYPHGLGIHKVMMGWPPGARGVLDYLYVPLATFTDPRVVQEDLLRSVWGGTYVTLWFDGHMHYLPRYVDAVRTVGLGILGLALLPTAAFVVGLARGVRRALEGELLDRVLVGLVGITLTGYVAFTLRNPWFPTVKGSYLLGIALPCSYYASEVLLDWSRTRARAAVLGGLGVLTALIVVVFWFGLVFAKAERPGFG